MRKTNKLPVVKISVSRRAHAGKRKLAGAAAYDCYASD